MNLSSQLKIRRVAAAAGAATTAVNGSAVDMEGFESVVFLGSFGTAAADNTLKAQASDDGSTGWADITGAITAPGGTDGVQFLEVVRPQKRYIRVVATRGTSSTLESMWAIQGLPAVSPVGNSTAGTINGLVKVPSY
jgi:hypothetical protein